MAETVRRAARITNGIIRDLRRRRHIHRLCLEWPRAIVELIDDIGVKSGRMTAIEQRLEHCVQLLDARVVDVVGADQPTPIPIHAVNDDDVPPEAA